MSGQLTTMSKLFSGKMLNTDVTGSTITPNLTLKAPCAIRLFIVFKNTSEQRDQKIN